MFSLTPNTFIMAAASAAVLIPAGAAVANNAAALANGAAVGPIVTTRVMPAPRSAIRVIKMSFRHLLFQEPEVPIQNWEVYGQTAVRPYFDYLLNVHLPFNVVAIFTFVRRLPPAEEGGADRFHDYHVAIPPVCCLDAYGATNDWDAFVLKLNTQLTQRLEDTPDESGDIFDHLASVQFTFVPLRDMAAVGAAAAGHAGGTYVPLPKWIQNKHCAMNPKNKDKACFQICMIAAELGTYDPRYGIPHAERWGNYTQEPIPPGRKPAWFKPRYIETDLKFETMPRDRSMPISTIGDWELENKNSVGVYVYSLHHVNFEGVEDEWQVLLRRPPGRIKFEKEVQLLLYKGHYSLITDFQAFICRKHMAIGPMVFDDHGRHTCHRCMRNFKGKETLEEHLTLQNCVDDSVYTVKRSLAPEGEDGSVPVQCFKKYRQLYFRPLVVYADFETTFTPDDNQSPMGDKTLVLGANQKVISAGYHAVGRDGFEVPKEHQAWQHCGTDTMDVFLISLFHLHQHYWQTKKHAAKPIIWTASSKRTFRKATSCAFCGCSFSVENIKVGDHNHFTGEFRNALCDSCNSIARLPHDIVIYFHNGGGFDFHFIMRGIADFKAGKYGEMTLHELATGHPDPIHPLKIKDVRVATIAKTAERCMQIRFGNYIFHDSMNFVKAGLDKLIKSQSKVSDDPALAFPEMARHHPLASVNLPLLLQKIPFPYSSMRDSTCFRLPALLPQECYADDFSGKPCSDEVYAQVKHIVETFDMKSFADYHKCYLHTDVLALADFMESMRTAFYNKMGVDMAESVSMASCAKEAMMLATRNTPVELISELNGGWDLMNDVNANIRGGLSNAFVSYMKANNPQVPGYDPYQDTTWMAYIDVNSLYPTAMCEMMPVGGYEAVKLSEDPLAALVVLNHILDNYHDESTTGYMCVVDYFIPDELHDKLDLAPIAKRTVPFEELSHRQRQVKEALGKQPQQQGPKLMPYLGEQKKIGHHIALLKFMRDTMGIQITKVHRIWKWRQSHWLRNYIQGMARERQQSTDPVEKDAIKISMNSLYGKFLQNKENYTETETYTDVEAWLRATWRVNVHKGHFSIIQGGVNANVVEPFLGTVTTAPAKGIVLDTPRLQGFAILELSKLVMYRLYYDVLKPFYGDRVEPLYMDTDSFILKLVTPNYMDDFEAINRSSPKQVFDMKGSGRPAPNAGMLGLAKIETETKAIAEFAALGPKMYSMTLSDENMQLTTCMKGKGIPERDLKRLHVHDDYRETVFQPTVDRQVTFRAMRSSRHQVTHRLITKRGLAADNDKVFQLGPFNSRPLGHWRNLLPQGRKDVAQLMLEQRLASQWGSLDDAIVEIRAMRVKEAAQKRENRKRKADGPAE